MKYSRPAFALLIACLMTSDLLARDFKETLKEAEKGNAIAQSDLGIMYTRGDGVSKDDVEAVKWFRKAAEQGLDNAQYNLGVMYYEGEGIPKDYAEAYAWLNLARAQGNSLTKFYLTNLERNMPKDQLARGQSRSTELHREIEARKAKK